MNKTPSHVLADSTILPISQKVVKNRIAKSALTEGLADPRQNNLPNDSHYELYRRWSKGGSGIIITGNVMVDRNCKEAPRNVILDEKTSDLIPFRRWADSIHQCGQDDQDTMSTSSLPPPLAIMQISHPGRQSPLSSTGLLKQPVAPTGGSKGRVRLPGGTLGKIAGSLCLLPPRQLTTNELPTIVSQFATSARLAEEATFDGIEIHAAHGYLLCQFLSPTGNCSRTDGYGGDDPRHRQKLIFQIIEAVREATSDDFVVGIKINSIDKRGDSNGVVEFENERLNLVEELCKLGTVDFIDLSGGNFEDAIFIGEGGVFFGSFAERVRDRIQHIRQSLAATAVSSDIQVPLIMVTGGFRSASEMESTVEKGNADIVALGRPLCIDPNVSAKILADPRYQIEMPIIRIPFSSRNAMLDSSLTSIWYQRQIDLLSQGKQPETNPQILVTIFWYIVMFLRLYVWDWKNPMWGNALVEDGHLKVD